MKNKSLTEQILTSQNTGNFFYYISNILPDPDTLFKEKGYDFKSLRELIKEPFFDGVWEKRIANIVRNNYQLIPQDNSKTQKEIVAYFENWLDKQNLHTLFSGFLDAVLFGYSVSEILWRNENNKYVIESVDEKPQEWVAFTPDGLLRLKSRKDGGVLEYKTYIDPPPFKFLVAKHFSTYQNPYGKKLVSILFWRFVFLKGGWRLFTIFVEKFGGATAWAKIPETKYEDNNFRDSILDSLDTLVSGGVGVAPDGVEIEYKESSSKGDTATLYQDYINELKKDIAIGVLGEQLTTIQNETGSRAATEVHNEVRKEKTDIDMSIIEPCMNELIRYFSFLNYGVDNPPIFLFDRKTSLNFELVERDKLLKEAYNIDFSEEYIREKYGLNEDDFVKKEANDNVVGFASEYGLPRLSNESLAEPHKHLTTNKHLLKLFAKENKQVSNDEKIIQEFLAKKGGELQAEFDKIIDNIVDSIDDISNTNAVFENIGNTYPDLDFETLCDVLGEVLYVSRQIGSESKKKSFNLIPFAIRKYFADKKKDPPKMNRVVNQDALNFLKEKKVIPSEDWDDFWQGEHSHIFTVAHSHTCNFLDKIHEYCNAMVSKGLSLDIFKNGLKKHCEKNGWYGGREAPTIKEGDSEEVKKEKQEKYLNWRLEIIAKTNCRTAYMAGKYQEMMRGAKLRPVWVYEAVMDGSTRAKHKALNNQAFWYDHPFWDTYFPPNDWGCRCSVISLTESAARDKKLDIKKSDQNVKIKDDFAPPEWRYNVAKHKWQPNWDNYKALNKVKIEGETLVDVIKKKLKEDIEDNNIYTPEGNFKEAIEAIKKLQTKDNNFNRHFDLKGLEYIYVEDIKDEIKNGKRYRTNAFYIKCNDGSGYMVINRINDSRVVNVLNRIYNKKPIYKDDVEAFGIFVHEHTHHLQKYLPWDDKKNPLNKYQRQVLEIFTELESRERIIAYLKEEYNGIKNDYDFDDFRKDGRGYADDVKIMSKFLDDNKDKIGNKDEVRKLFTKATREDGFKIHNSIDLLLPILNRKGAKFTKEDIEKIFKKAKI